MRIMLCCVALMLAADTSAAPVPTHLMKPGPVRVGDQFRFDCQPHYVYRAEGNRVWAWIGDHTGGLESDLSPFTVAEVEAIRGGCDLPTDRIWRLMSQRSVVPYP